MCWGGGVAPPEAPPPSSGGPRDTPTLQLAPTSPGFWGHPPGVRGWSAVGVQPEALRKEGGRELGTRRGFLSIFLEPPSWGLAFGGGEADWKEPRWSGGWLCLHRGAQAFGRGLGS